MLVRAGSLALSLAHMATPTPEPERHPDPAKPPWFPEFEIRLIVHHTIALLALLAASWLVHVATKKLLPEDAIWTEILYFVEGVYLTAVVVLWALRVLKELRRPHGGSGRSNIGLFFALP